MSKSLTVCSEWRPGLNSGNFETVHHQGLVARAAAPPPLLCNAEHDWTNFHRWLCFLDYLIWNTWIWVGEVLSAHRILNGLCLEHVNCYLIVSIPKALRPGIACWTLKISWSFLPSVGFPCLQIKAMTFILEVFCMGFCSACEAVRCWSAVCLAGYEYEIWNTVVDGMKWCAVKVARHWGTYWAPEAKQSIEHRALCSYKTSFCGGGGKIFAHKIN